MKIKDSYKHYCLLFLLGIIAGVVCRLTDYFPYEDLWSLSSIATLFGFWIASVGGITYFSSSNKGAFINTFLYLFGMTISFYVLKYILGFTIPIFSNNGCFQTDLFIIYSILSLICGMGSFVLFSWNNNKATSSFLYAMPASGLIAEFMGCLIVLINHQMFLAQTLFDLVFALLFGVVLFKKAPNKIAYLGTLMIVSLTVYFLVYHPYLSIL